MFVIDPNNPATEDDGTAAADAAAAAVAEQNAGEGVAASADAFTAGVEAARAIESAEEGAAAAAPSAADQPQGGEEAANQDAAAGAENAAEQAGQDPAASKDPAAAAVADVEKEINELGITNERTQKRFRELSERAAEVESLRPMAQRFQQWEETITATGASPEQMGTALNYLAAVNSRDPVAMAQAYDFMAQEMAWLGKELGRPAHGYDPLSDHPDLAQQVSDGDITREAAQEVAAARRTTALAKEHTQRASQASTQQAQAEAAINEGVKAVAELGQQLRQLDPAFQAKYQVIMPQVQLIQTQLPPNEWAPAIKRLYLSTPAPTPAPAPAPAPAKVHNPARSSGVDLSAGPRPGQEFEFGVELARAAGR